jgi:hypothetical protein
MKMSLLEKVREVCSQATRGVTDLRDALGSAIASYKPQSELAESRTAVLKDFTKDMDEAVETMRCINGRVILDPSGLWNSLKFYLMLRKMPLKKIEQVSPLAEYAMQGLEEGVHEFADRLASDGFLDQYRPIVRGNLIGQASGAMREAIRGNPMVSSLTRVYCTKNMVDQAAKPIMKYVEEDRELWKRVHSM